MTTNTELIALVSEFLESVHAGEWTGDVSRDEALVAFESLTQQLAELQAKLEDALKDRVALAMALDCGHRPPCEECRLYSPAAQQAQPEQVNAILAEALQAAEKLEHEALVALSEATYELKVGNTYTTATDTYKANNDLIHRLDKILNSQYRDRKRTALTAAKQAQPAGTLFKENEWYGLSESAKKRLAASIEHKRKEYADAKANYPIVALEAFEALRTALAQHREQQPVCHGCGIPAGDVHMSTCKSGKWPSRVSNGDTAAPARQAQPEPVNQVLLKALSAMLTHSGMDEDEWSKPTFDQARAAIMLATTKTQECGMCGYVGTKTDAVGQCPRCHWDELQAQPERAPLSCTWTQEDDFDMPGVYHTSCGEMWSFTEGGIKENNTKFCPHCGGGIKQGGQHD